MPSFGSSNFGTPATGTTVPTFGSTFATPASSAAPAFGKYFLKLSLKLLQLIKFSSIYIFFLGTTFGIVTSAPTFGTSFGAPQQTASLFGSSTKPSLFGASTSTPSLFSTPAGSTSGLFGTTTSQAPSLFGNSCLDFYV